MGTMNLFARKKRDPGSKGAGREEDENPEYYMPMIEDNGFHAWVCRRLRVISVEDVGLADLEVIRDVYMITEMFERHIKESGGDPPTLILALAVLRICRAKKSHEVTKFNAYCWLRWASSWEESWQEVKLTELVKKYQTLVVDGHTSAGWAHLKRKYGVDEDGAWPKFEELFHAVGWKYNKPTPVGDGEQQDKYLS